jgi:S-adenosylmethionine-diacylgycerolhomoserine-N-methlytransferase
MLTIDNPQAHAMDRLYAGQKRVFDLTRKYYLLGRDQLIERMTIAPGATVCELGAGTARNLILLARRHPQGRFYGVDISAEMLDQAAINLARAGLGESIAMRHAPAEELDYHGQFGLAAPFDAVVFSYCLSMLPVAALRPAIDAAWANVAPGGTLYYVDFGPMLGWPAPARRVFARWLGLFHAHYRQDVVDALTALAPRREVESVPLYGGYALLMTVRKPAATAESPLGRTLIDLDGADVGAPLERGY